MLIAGISGILSGMRVGLFIRLVVLCAGFLAVTACAPVQVVNTLTPSGAYTLERDLVYGPEERHRMDVYTPSRTVSSEAKHPVVVFFYGGSWRRGEKQQYEFVGHALSRRGLVVVIADYRLYPDVRFPEFIEDGARAVDWVFRNAPDHGGDPEQVFLMGHSAGAHIAALLASDPDYLAAHGRHPEHLAGLIGLAGPYNFLPLESERLRRIFGEEKAEQRRSQPIAHVHERMPPALFLHGTADERVLPANSHSFAAAILLAGGHAEVIEYPGHGHIRILASMSHLLRFLGNTTDDVEQFIRRTRSPPGGVGGPCGNSP